MSTKRALLGLLVATCIALVFALPVFATVGDAGYMTWSSFGGTNGTSPHGGYSNTTQKCVVCHAVHEAATTGQILLPDTVAEACNYCHVDTLSSYTQVYNSQPLNYSNGPTDLNNAHNSIIVAAVETGVKCTSCHQVHAAQNVMTSNAYLTQKLLKVSSNVAASYDPDLPSIPQAGDTSATALTKWCTTCHAVALGAKGSPDYYTQGFNGQTHVMTNTIAAYGNAFSSVPATQVAWAASDQCSSCHASGYQTSAWPHFTTGVRFLTAADSAAAVAGAATDSEQDGICLRCHKSGTGLGVNMGF